MYIKLTSGINTSPRISVVPSRNPVQNTAANALMKSFKVNEHTIITASTILLT